MSVTSDVFDSASSLVPPTSGIRNRRRRYQNGSLGTVRRSQCSHPLKKTCPDCVRFYRFFELIDGKKVRRKVFLGTVEQLPTNDDAKRTSEPYRMLANTENPRRDASIPALADLYIERVLRPCMRVPLGGIQDPSARMGYSCANNYRGQIKRWVIPRWKKYLVSDFERPEICEAAEDWFRSLRRSPENPTGLAPKTVRVIFATMGQLMKFAVRWGYLSKNPFVGKKEGERRIDPPRGSTKRLHKAAQLTPAQFFQLASHLSLRERAAVTFAAWLEPRGSETFGLKWKDLDLSAALVQFQRGFDMGRETPGKTDPSNTVLPIPDEVIQVLREWHSVTPYNQPEDWVFASWAKKGAVPIGRYHLMRAYIQPIAKKLGFPHPTWYSFRHSLNALARECSSRQDRQILLRHGSGSSSEDGYGEVPIERKWEIAQRVWTVMRHRLGADKSPGTSLPNSTDVQIPPKLAADTSHSRLVEPSGDQAAVQGSVEQDREPLLKKLEHESRSAAARKAWVTRRENEGKEATGTNRSDPDLPLNAGREIA